ncbi:hypothetical protein Q9L58_008201 [Maublancomyces gigas]|uniref:HTH LytTR-type domain-containing protein n=1 Tax=Discina gigas TaxID=1032678 RepID=A0ABR3GAD5_9PEZI
MEVVQAGRLYATSGRLTLEWLEQVENNYLELFLEDGNAVALHPNSVGYRLKRKVDELGESLDGFN